MLCHDCGSTIEEGRKERAPVLAQFCLRCRSARRRRANLKYVWRPEYDEYLKAHYHGGLNRRFQVLNRMIRETGLPRWYIKRRAAGLGLTMHQDKRLWTTTEESVLERLLGKVSALTIARRLKRTEASVVLKIKRLGVSRRVRSGYTMRDLEQCLGESHHKIQQWIENGWLRDRLQGTRRHNGNGRDIHRIQERDILKFIREHPLEIHLDRVEALWFLDLVLLKGKEMSDTRSPSRSGVDGEAA
ncbi:MAG: hypothetical protein ACLQOO_24950 [Terriglobia bacterium]